MNLACKTDNDTQNQAAAKLLASSGVKPEARSLATGCVSRAIFHKTSVFNEWCEDLELKLRRSNLVLDIRPDPAASDPAVGSTHTELSLDSLSVSFSSSGAPTLHQ